MDPLTPELERRLQVEELWARRNVLADSMNARRLEQFREQYSVLTHFGMKGQSVPSPDKPEAPLGREDLSARFSGLLAPAAADLPAVAPARRLWWIGAPTLAAAILVLAASDPLPDMPFFTRTAFHNFLPSLTQAAQPSALGSTPRTDTARSDRDLPDLRAQVAAEIATSVGQHAHSPQMLQALQSRQSRNDATIRSDQ